MASDGFQSIKPVIATFKAASTVDSAAYYEPTDFTFVHLGMVEPFVNKSSLNVSTTSGSGMTNFKVHNVTTTSRDSDVMDPTAFVDTPSTLHAEIFKTPPPRPPMVSPLVIRVLLMSALHWVVA